MTSTAEFIDCGGPCPPLSHVRFEATSQCTIAVVGGFCGQRKDIGGAGRTLVQSLARWANPRVAVAQALTSMESSFSSMPA